MRMFTNSENISYDINAEFHRQVLIIKCGEFIAKCKNKRNRIKLLNLFKELKKLEMGRYGSPKVYMDDLIIISDELSKIATTLV